MKKEQGITLIALIITIIILLILAGVTINLTIGENGLFKTAQQAAKNYIEAEKEEMYAIEEVDAMLKGYADPWNGEVATGFASGGGQTKEDPYIIENAGQLAYLASQVNAGETYEGKYIKITKHINLGNIEFTPIGTGSTGTRSATEWNMTERYFNGTLDGEGHIITGVKITQTDMHGVGIIGVLGEKGIVKNINTYEGTVIGKTCVGGIVGASKGTITNCINKLTVIAQDDETSNSGQMAGGIVGCATKGTIENCKNYGNVTTKDDSVLTGRGKAAGGIVGFAYLEEDMTISNCSNSGTIIAVYQQVGGIVGSNDEYTENAVLTINNCTNSGEVRTADTEGKLQNSLAGGIIGWAYRETNITNCTNSGTITAARNSAGGIVGTQIAGTISDCSNSGDVTALDIMAGGIVGLMQGTGDKSITNCTNSGTITAACQTSGGIVGKQESGTISDCSNSGNVVANATGGRGIVGGIVASQSGGSITNVYNSASVSVGDNSSTKVDAIGGIVGLQSAGSLNKAYNKGTLNGGDAVGGVVGQKKLAPTVEDTYYYTSQNIKGIGSESDTTTAVTAVNDVVGKTDKTLKDIDSLDNFLKTQMP